MALLEARDLVLLGEHDKAVAATVDIARAAMDRPGTAPRLKRAEPSRVNPASLQVTMLKRGGMKP